MASGVGRDDRPAGTASAAVRADGADFRVETERFADVRMLRYRVPGFEALPPRTKELLYYLYEAALAGREIIYDQKYRYNLAIKRTLEQVVQHYPGDRDTDAFRALVGYLKRIWFSNGIHHHYSNDKFVPGFDYATFASLVKATPGEFPVRPGQTLDALLAELEAPMFDAAVDAKLVAKGGYDVLAASAINYYRGVSQADAAAFYAARAVSGDPAPVSQGLNSQLVDTNAVGDTDDGGRGGGRAAGRAGGDGALVERTWKVGGLYGAAIERMVFWLEKAVAIAENDAQRDALAKLIRYYESGDLKDWDAYNIAWVRDTESVVDAIHGFIEVYHDPMGLRGSFEAVVSFRDPVATQRIATIARNAQWFEDHAPLSPEHKKAHVTGITGKVITVVVESGDAAPTTPIGINLPNADWIRQAHGSKSVALSNISDAYEQVRGGADREFAWNEEDAAQLERYGALVGNLHTDLHEVIGHASGQIEPGVGTLYETVKNYGSTLEEARADLVALYFIVDPKLVELGLLPSVEVGRIEYDRYIRNGLQQQLYRVEPGKNVEEDHMRNRQLVAAWAYEHGKADHVIERRVRDGKTYFIVNDYDRLRELFGELLRELQRIKSQGDYAAIRELVETYAVQVDRDMHREVLERYAKLNVPPYAGFIQPKLVPVERDGRIADVRVEYPEDFSAQMLEYARRYAFLPAWN